MTPEDFRDAEEALKRSEWLTRQSMKLRDSSEDAIQQSRETLEAVKVTRPVYKGPQE